MPCAAQQVVSQVLSSCISTRVHRDIVDMFYANDYELLKTAGQAIQVQLQFRATYLQQQRWPYRLAAIAWRGRPCAMSVLILPSDCRYSTQSDIHNTPRTVYIEATRSVHKAVNQFTRIVYSCLVLYCFVSIRFASRAPISSESSGDSAEAPATRPRQIPNRPESHGSQRVAGQSVAR